MHSRDQDRARYAHACIDALDATSSRLSGADRARYRTLVNDLGTNIMRCGLCTALAFIERDLDRNRRGKADDGEDSGAIATAEAALLDHLAHDLRRRAITGLGDVSGAKLCARVRELDVASYMALTREALQLALWLRRAVQARPSAGAPTARDNRERSEDDHA